MTTELIQLTNQPKPVVAATISSDDPIAASGAKMTRAVGPRPTPINTERAGDWARWILCGRLFVVILFVIIVTPLINIAVHVAQIKVI